MRQVSDAEYQAMTAALAGEQKKAGRPAPKPAQGAATSWMPDSWPVIFFLVIACWPVAVWHAPVSRWVALVIWWAVLVPMVLARVAGKRG